MFEISKQDINNGVGVLDLLAEKSKVFASKGDARRSIKENALSINQEKISNPEVIINSDSLLNNKYILVRKGKKNYSLLKIL